MFTLQRILKARGLLGAFSSARTTITKRYNSDSKEYDNFDFDDLSDDENIFETEAQSQSKLIADELIFNDLEANMPISVIVKNVKITEFLELLKFQEYNFSRKSYSIIVKNMTRCVAGSNGPEVAQFMNHPQVQPFLQKIFEEILSNAYDVELVDLICLLSAVSKKINKFTSLLGFSNEQINLLIQLLTKKTKENAYDLRALIKLGEASVILNWNVVIGAVVSQLSNQFKTNPKLIDEVETYMFIKMASFCHNVIDISGNCDNIWRAMILGNNRWIDFNLSEKLFILKNVMYAKTLSKQKQIANIRHLINSIFRSQCDPKTLSSHDIMLGLKVIKCFDSEHTFVQFNDLIFQAVEYRFSQLKELKYEPFLADLIELIYLVESKVQVILKASLYIPLFINYLSLPINPKDHNKSWNKVYHTLTVTLITAPLPLIQMFEPVIRNILPYLIEHGKPILLLQFLRKEEAKSIILDIYYNHPDKYDMQMNALSHLNINNRLGLNELLPPEKIPKEIDLKILWLNRINDEMLDYIESRDEILSELSPSVLFNVLAAVKRRLPERQALQDLLLKTISVNFMKFIKISSTRIPMYPKSPEVLLDLIIKGFPKYQIKTTQTVIEMLANRPVFRVQVAKSQKQLTSIFIKLLKDTTDAPAKEYLSSFTIYLINYYIVHCLLPNRFHSNYRELIQIYLDFLAKNGLIIHTGVLAEIALNYIKIDETHISSDRSHFQLSWNIQHLAFVNPSLLEKFPTFKVNFQSTKNKVFSIMKQQSDRVSYIEQSLKLCESKEDLIKIITYIKQSIHIHHVQHILFKVILVHDSRIQGAFSLAKDSLENYKIKYPEHIFDIMTIAAHFVTPDQISAEAVKFIRKLFGKTKIPLSRFSNFYMKDFIQFIRIYCIFNKEMVTPLSRADMNIQSIALFSFAALLRSKNEKWIQRQLQIIRNEVHKMARESYFNFCILQLHLENNPIFLTFNNLQFSDDDFELDGSYSEYLLQEYFKAMNPVMIFQIKKIVPDFGKDNLFKHLKDASWLHKSLINHEIDFTPYIHGNVSLRAAEIKEKNLVVVESSAGSGQMDFVAETEVAIIQKLTPEKKVMIFDKQSWLEMDSTERKSYLTSIGLKSQA